MTTTNATTNNTDLNWIANSIWGIADDVLRDLYVRGKYRDVILPMTVLRRRRISILRIQPFKPVGNPRPLTNLRKTLSDSYMGPFGL